jgi:hypothetical protein
LIHKRNHRTEASRVRHLAFFAFVLGALAKGGGRFLAFGTLRDAQRDADTDAFPLTRSTVASSLARAPLKRIIDALCK